MAGINLSQLNIPKSEEPVKRKHVIRLDELSDAYSNPEKLESLENNSQPSQMREIRRVRGVENEPVKKGELKGPEEQLKKLDKKLEKVEIKTKQLIDKSKKQVINSLQIKNISPRITTYQEQIKHDAKSKKEASLVEFYCLKGLPKSIITHIKEKARHDDQLLKWISIIDTEELKLITKKTASHLSVQMLRLEKQGWFQILKSNNAGVRVLEIDPALYSIKQ